MEVRWVVELGRLRALTFMVDNIFFRELRA